MAIKVEAYKDRHGNLHPDEHAANITDIKSCLTDLWDDVEPYTEDTDIGETFKRFIKNFMSNANEVEGYLQAFIRTTPKNIGKDAFDRNESGLDSQGTFG